MSVPDIVCAVCRGERRDGWRRSSLRRCHFHEPSTQHYVCFGCVRDYDLLVGTTDWDGMRELRTCPLSAEFQVELAILGDL